MWEPKLESDHRRGQMLESWRHPKIEDPSSEHSFSYQNGAPWGDATFAAVLATLGAGFDVSYGGLCYVADPGSSQGNLPPKSLGIIYQITQPTRG